MHVKTGTPFLPDVLRAIAERYSFQKFPVTFDEMAAESRIFHMGRWKKNQIDELGIYNDGIIAAAPARTDVAAEMIDDLFDFVEQEYGFEMSSTREFRYYESAVVIELAENITSKLAVFYNLTQSLADFQESYNLFESRFELSRFAASVDPTLQSGRSPMPFTLERRTAEPFVLNRWYSAAPLKTEDHLSVLADLERALS